MKLISQYYVHNFVKNTSINKGSLLCMVCKSLSSSSSLVDFILFFFFFLGQSGSSIQWLKCSCCSYSLDFIIIMMMMMVCIGLSSVLRIVQTFGQCIFPIYIQVPNNFVHHFAFHFHRNMCVYVWNRECVSVCSMTENNQNACASSK